MASLCVAQPPWPGAFHASNKIFGASTLLNFSHSINIEGEGEIFQSFCVRKGMQYDKVEKYYRGTIEVNCGMGHLRALLTRFFCF
jgi:hypothetical protein